MKRKITKKALSLGLICLVFAMPPATFSWNQPTHAYIADRLGARVGRDNLNEMWGSVTPDFFNFVFDPVLCPGWVSDQTHGTYSDTFLKVWNAADTDVEHALAFGFVTHNQAWGADHAAHIACRTCGQNDGYVIVKARQLLAAPYPANPEQTFGDIFEGTLGMSPEEASLVAHVVIEEAVDIRLANEVDPLIGRKLATAARSETKRFQPLLVKAFSADYAANCFSGDEDKAAEVLTAAEKQHRKDMTFIGEAISRPEQDAVKLLAEQLVGVFPDFLGRPLPVPDADAVELVAAAIFSSMAICDDYKEEIVATIEFVGNNIEENGITYSMRPKHRP
jgi:hypothetical protein